jgi:hypothetical protein
MLDNHISALPIVSDGVSRRNLLQALATNLATTPVAAMTAKVIPKGVHPKR